MCQKYVSKGSERGERGTTYSFQFFSILLSWTTPWLLPFKHLLLPSPYPYLPDPFLTHSPPYLIPHPPPPTHISHTIYREITSTHSPPQGPRLPLSDAISRTRLPVSRYAAHRSKYFAPGKKLEVFRRYLGVSNSSGTIEGQTEG